MKKIWIFMVLLAIAAIMLPASIAAKEQCTCSAEMQAKIQVMENALVSMKAMCAISDETVATSRNEPSEEEVYNGGNEPAGLERCTVSSLRNCYGSIEEEEAEFDEEDAVSCLRTQRCAGPEEEIAAGGAELALSEISAEDKLAAYRLHGQP